MYRWWSNKAEVLYEASVIDARQELAVSLTGVPRDDLRAYLDALTGFLAHSHAGAAYRALLGRPSTTRTWPPSSRPAMSSARARPRWSPCCWRPHGGDLSPEQATALLIGPVFFHILSGRGPESVDTKKQVEQFLRALAAD